MNNSRRTPKNRKTRRWIWIAVGTIMAVILAVGGWIVYTNWQEEQRAIQRQEDVEAAVDSYLTAKTAADFDTFVSTLSAQSVSEFDYTDEELAERYETIFQGIGANDLAIMDQELLLNEETDQYTLTYTLRMDTVLGRLDDLRYETVIQETEDDITLQWGPSLILPGMEEGDSVRVSFTEPDRGSIYDRHGNLLAGEGDAYQAGLYPASLGEGDQRATNLDTISETFGVSIDQLENLLNQAWVTDESLVPFTVVEEGETPEVTGVRYQRTSERVYPLNEAAAHLIGYIGEVTAEDIQEDPTLASGQIVGKAGLEAVFDSQLRGHTGGQISIVDNSDEVKEVVIENERQNGQSVRLTIDSDVQRELFDSFDNEPGAGAVMHPQTGELLAMVSAPSYSPQSFTRGISAEEYSGYMDDENTPFVNRYTSRYAPGSTFKILSSLILLDDGGIDPDETNRIEGLQWSPDLPGFGDHSITRVSESVSDVDLATALIYSDNIYFAMEALEMGEEAFTEALNQLPFGDNLDLPFDMTPAQFANDDTIDSETLLADTAYGQGQVLMNLIHQLVFYSPVVNDGRLTYPTVLLNEQRENGNQLFTEESASIVRNDLIESVTHANGTARGLQNVSHTVGAKTGTAEIAGEEGNDTNGFLYVFDADDQSYSFVGFLEGQRSGDVIERFDTFLDNLKPSISDYAVN